MENKENKNMTLTITIVIIALVIMTLLGWLVFSGVLSGNETVEVTDNNEENNEITTNEEIDNNTSLETCTEEVYDKLKILSMENKIEKVGAMGGSRIGYNVTTTVTKEHNYNSTPESEELYAYGYYPDTVFVLYKNKLYYTNQEDVISKYCEVKEVLIDSKIHSRKLTCDYSQFNDDNIEEFMEINIDADLKAIGSYGNAGSASPTPYAITTDGKVITITRDSNNNYKGCGIMYDDSKHPIDRIFYMQFYDNIEYTILLKDGTLITRDVDREHPIEFEH